MSNKKEELKETFRRFDQYLNGKISWSLFDMHGVLINDSTHMTTSEIDDIFGEFGTCGEDRVFGAPHWSSVSVKTKPVVNTEVKKETGPDSDDKKIYMELQVPKKPLEPKQVREDWVLIQKDDISD